MKTKICTKCNKNRKTSLFNNSRGSKDGLDYWCRPCTSKQSTAYRNANPKVLAIAKQKWKLANKQREQNNNTGHNLKRYWPGSTPQQAITKYNELLLKQDNKCAICGKHESCFKAALHVDHSHLTNKVRGLLCFSCNSVLGHVKEDVVLLMAAINYLRLQA